MKTPLLWSCLVLLGVLLAWLLWLAQEGSVLNQDSTGAQGKPDPAAAEAPTPTPTQKARAQAPGQEKGEDSRQQLPATPRRSMRVCVLRKADRTPVAGADVTVRKSGSASAVAAKATTDASGTVLIARPGERCLVDAASGDMWGQLYVHRRSKEPFEILLEKNHVLRVRVRSQSTGAPVAGIFVGLRRFSLYGIPHHAAFERTASPDGVATFSHVQQYLNRTGRWQVFLGVPLRKQSFAPVSIDELPTEPLELVLPDTGSVLIKIHDENRAPVDPKRVHCTLSVYPTENRVKPIVESGAYKKEEGLVRVEPVGLGLFLRAKVSSEEPGSRRKPVTVDFLGPKRPGETATCEVLWPSDKDPEAFYPVVVGRLVRNDRSPWPKAKILVHAMIFPTPASHTRPRAMELSSEGRFQLVLREPCPEGGKRTYRIWTDGKGEFGAMEARLDLSRKFPPGETDIGDIVLDLGQLLVSGRVVDAEGKPLPKARLYVTQRVVTGRQELWPRVDCAGWGQSVAKDGTFALYAIQGMELPSGRLRLKVSCPELVPPEPIEFPMGTKGLRIVLQAGGSLAGSIQLLPGQAGEEVRVMVSVEDKSYSTFVKRDGSFRCGPLPAGSAKLRAYSRGAGPNRGGVVIKNLVIQPGVINRDPRIQNLVVADIRMGAQVQVFGEGGEPVVRAIVRRLDKPTGDKVYTDHKGHCFVQAKEFPMKVSVTGFGYAEERATLEVGKKNKVILSRAMTIELHTRARTIGKDPDYHLGFFIYHVDVKGRGVTRHVYENNFPYQRLQFDANGKASIPVPGPGTYEIQPRVYILGKDNIGRGGWVGKHPYPRIQVVAGKPSQSFEIHVSAGELADAVSRYSK